MKVEDERFAHLTKDPRFKKVGKEKKKVKIDNRFKHMFTAPEFASVDFLDQRGRKEKQVTREKLERFYELSSEEEGEGEEKVKEDAVKIPEKGEGKKKRKKEKQDIPPPEPSSEEEESEVEVEESEVEEEDSEVGEELSDSSDGESTEDEAEDTLVGDAWDAVNTCTETIADATHRVSICNLNWDRMNATDIFVLCSSALHESPGSLEKVEVFPSQYGKQQLSKELESGPVVGEKSDETGDDGNGDKEYSNEALRKYQIDRLKYYYAIVTCDSAVTGNALYNELDGVEYQLSSSVLDLRFVPNDMEFDDDPPTSVCTCMPDMTSYKPPSFITTALQNSSVKLTWDETDQSRLQLTTKKFSAGDLETVDFSAYIASSESEGEEGEGRSLEKYKALLAGVEEDEGEGDVDQEMEITWTTGLEDNNQVVEEADKNENRQENATPYEPDEADDFFATDTVMERPKEKKKKKKRKKGGEKDMTTEETELALLMEGEKDEKKHFDMKKIVKSGKGGDFEVDIGDERFSAIKKSHHYAIDPSAPEYRDTRETQRLRATQAASLAESEERHEVAGGEAATSGNMIEKIKHRSKQFQAKKDNSKIFKTKNSGKPPSSEVNSDPNASDPVVQVRKKKRKADIVEASIDGAVKPKGIKKKKLKNNI